MVLAKSAGFEICLQGEDGGDMNCFRSRLLIFLATSFSTALLSAATITFATMPGSTVGDGAVDAEVTFTPGAGSLVITLTDLLANPKSAGQLISDLQFSLSSSSTPMLSGSSANLVTVNGDGSTTSAGTGVTTGWGFGTFGGGFILCVICPDGLSQGPSAQPTQEIIGPGPYTTANGSIAGNNGHNPFIDQSATFTISDSAITANTTVSDVTFSFGTTFGAGNSTSPGIGLSPTVPEPTTYALCAAGLLGLACVRRRRPS
jgi:hypothetical protein